MREAKLSFGLNENEAEADTQISGLKSFYTTTFGGVGCGIKEKGIWKNRW